MLKLLSFVLVFTLSSCAIFRPNPNRDKTLANPQTELKQFTSDYCSDFPDGTFTNPKQWADCCFSHDLHYWIGGTEQERELSDVALKECVNKTGASIDSFLMYIGVRMGGKPGDASYSWGYGWTTPRDYIQLPASDINHSKSLLKRSKFYQSENTRKLINIFINDYLDKRI